MKLLVICGLALLLVPAALAAKPATSAKVSLSIVEAAPYVFGETIHPVSNVQSYGDRGPYYSLYCYQPDPVTGQPVTVFGIAQYRVYPLDGSTVAFVLAGQQWTGGAADCDLSVWHVNAGFKNQTTDATLSFHVGA